jgi:hypothetical protein
MRTFALLIMSFLAFSAYGSRPIMGDEALACISGGMPSKVGEMHGVSFNNGYELDALRPGTFASAAVLKSAKQHSATFMVDGLITQTINFSFNDFPGSDVCFRYDNREKIWSVSKTERNFCQSCSSEIEVRVGLYQSEPFALNSPNASTEPYRLYMRVFPGKKIALVISPATGEEISRQLLEGSDMAGDNSYVESDNGITFSFGPTQHTVTPVKAGSVRLISMYANGNIVERNLSFVNLD